jgi:RNA polymerase sigma-70 factor (ECF subfamily)
MVAAVSSAPACLPECAAAPGEIDLETLQSAQRGDAAATERFIRHYQRTVFAFLSRVLGRVPDLEDLAQEVFLRAYRALPRFELRHDARVSTWLLTIAVRLALDSNKRARPDPAELQLHVQAAATSSPERQHLQREILLAFERAAAQLPPEQRVAFVLAQFHGLSVEQIAAITNTKVATVKTRLFRARSQLRELLRPAFEEYGP